ncbi:kinase [Thraustotheca clavata]|uniref:Kinase n=1 Tax=Thraustotheca clavata TaxID=74557 RepID=A0A1V9Z7H0_9STRA|nr:kinase [Thraustotheca clavata]
MNTTSFPNANAIGDLTGYRYNTIRIVANSSKFDMSTMVLPSALEEFAIDSVKNFNFQTLPKDKIKGLRTLSNLTSINFEYIPESVLLFNRLIVQSDLTGNINLQHLVGLDFTQLDYLSLCDNINLRTIDYVSFGKLNHLYFAKLELFLCCISCCKLCQITNFTVTQESYDNLNYHITGSSCASDTNLGCAVVDSGTSFVNKTACTSINGKVQNLWNSSLWQACVVEGKNPTPVPTTVPLATTFLPTITSPTTNEQSHSSSIIIGVVVGVVAALTGLGLFFWCRRRKGNQNSSYALNQTPRQTNQTTAANTLPGTAPSNESDRENPGYDLTPLRPLRLELLDLVAIERLSSGAYGEVWRGTYGRKNVAIKRIKDKSIRHAKKFADEIILLSRIDCPYIVQLVGASWERPLNLECVVEFMDMGDLYNYLAKTTPHTFTWKQKLKSIESVVFGLIYLHTLELPIIHRDLKSRNILLDSTKGTKLTDFGESREVEDDNDTLTNNIGTFKWMAPEVMMQTSYSTAADVYSLGVVLTEYSTHHSPYSNMINPNTKKPYTQQHLTAMVLKGEIRPTIDKTHTPVQLQELATRCLSYDPNDRPSTLQIQQIIREVMLQNDKSEW